MTMTRACAGRHPARWADARLNLEGRWPIGQIDELRSGEAAESVAQ